MAEIVIIGSLNMDLSVKVARIPEPGETITGSGLVINAGGKGANQAVACARLGRKVTLVGKVGRDDFGREMTRNLDSQGVETGHILTAEHSPSGTAMIMVDAKGENCIVVSPGSNDELTPEDIVTSEDLIKTGKILLLQLEIPLETVLQSIRIAHKYNIPILLNPAPARELPDAIFAHLTFLVPNETETKILTGIDVTDDRSAQTAADRLMQRGVKNVVITLGDKGAYIASEGYSKHIPALKIIPVDSTAAGDAFIGGLAATQVEGATLEESVRFACCVGALAATKFGAQSSLPSLQEVLEIYHPEGGVPEKVEQSR